MSPEKDDEPTQTTEQGYEIPVPAREDVFAALAKVAKADDAVASATDGE